MTNWRSVLAGTVLVAATLAAGAAVWFVQTAEPRLRARPRALALRAAQQRRLDRHPRRDAVPGGPHRRRQPRLAHQGPSRPVALHHHPQVDRHRQSPRAVEPAPAAGADRRRRDHRAARPQAGLEAPARQRRDRRRLQPRAAGRRADRRSAGSRPRAHHRAAARCRSRPGRLGRPRSGHARLLARNRLAVQRHGGHAAAEGSRLRHRHGRPVAQARPADAAAPGPVHLRWRPGLSARPGGRDPRGGERPGRARAAGDGGQGVVTGAGPAQPRPGAACRWPPATRGSSTAPRAIWR